MITKKKILIWHTKLHMKTRFSFSSKRPQPLTTNQFCDHFRVFHILFCLAISQAFTLSFFNNNKTCSFSHFIFLEITLSICVWRLVQFSIFRALVFCTPVTNNTFLKWRKMFVFKKFYNTRESWIFVICGGVFLSWKFGATTQ